MAAGRATASGGKCWPSHENSDIVISIVYRDDMHASVAEIQFGTARF